VSAGESTLKLNDIQIVISAGLGRCQLNIEDYEADLVDDKLSVEVVSEEPPTMFAMDLLFDSPTTLSGTFKSAIVCGAFYVPIEFTASWKSE
jgi:hypothetical protein